MCKTWTARGLRRIPDRTSMYRSLPGIWTIFLFNFWCNWFHMVHFTRWGFLLLEWSSYNNFQEISSKFSIFFLYPPALIPYLSYSRFEKLYQGRKRFKTEGLNSLEYRRVAMLPCKLFTWVIVELTPPDQNSLVVAILKNSFFGKLFGFGGTSRVS